MTVLYSQTQKSDEELLLRRRGYEYGWIKLEGSRAMPSPEEIKLAWANDQAILLPSILTPDLPQFAGDIAQAHWLMEQTLEGAELSGLLEAEPYPQRLLPDFDLSGAGFEDNDDQGIEKVIFDAWQDDDIVADNLWCKASWLSFDDEDGSVRFRFSFGIEGYEDVASDPVRQTWAAKLTEAVFPESRAITQNAGLKAILAAMLDCEQLEFTERIVYFNAPNGGAQMHHDVERGHEGVVFAQMSGATFWLALSKPRLMDEIQAFLAEAPIDEWAELRSIASERQRLADYLGEADHEWAEELIDRHPGFFQHLIERGYAHVLRPGDVLLMPQRSLDTCVWHSVICLGNEAGEGLSFALKSLSS